MKSKRAKEYINEWYERTQQTDVDLVFCENAVKLAEQDVSELCKNSALRAYCHFCIAKPICTDPFDVSWCKKLECFEKEFQSILNKEEQYND